MAQPPIIWIKIWITNTGKIDVRDLSRDDAILVSHQIEALRAKVLPRVPEAERRKVETKLDRLKEETAKAEAARTLVNRDIVPLTPPPEVVALFASAAEARALGAVNNKLDHYIGIVGSLTAVNLNRDADLPTTWAAGVFGQTVFYDGSGFLKYESARQWMETANRWRELDQHPDATKAAETLGVVREVNNVRFLNRYFGQMQGLVDDGSGSLVLTPPQQQLEQASEAISGLFIELLALGNTLWSDLDEKQAAENRMLLVGPYVDQLRELTRAASARGLKARSKDEEPDAEKEPTESAEPTPATDSAEAAEATPATTSAEPAASVRPEEPEDGTS